MTRTPPTDLVVERNRAPGGAPIACSEVVSTSTSWPRLTRASVNSFAIHVGPPKATAGQYAGAAKRIRSRRSERAMVTMTLPLSGHGDSHHHRRRWARRLGVRGVLRRSRIRGRRDRERHARAALRSGGFHATTGRVVARPVSGHAHPRHGHP